MNDQAKTQPVQNRRQKLRNYLIGIALIAFVIGIYALTWYKIASKSL